MSLEEKQNFIISNQVVLITIDQNLKDGDEENVHIMFNTQEEGPIDEFH